MWYIFQTIIAVAIAYYWTTFPENSPKDFGHGLFLGYAISWMATLVMAGVIEVITEKLRKARSLAALLIDRRRKKHLSKQISITRSVRSRPPNLIP